METQRSKKRKISDDLITYRGNSGHLIPRDLIQDVLVWLPSKTLVRFVCVSKQFESIIRSRDFMKSHLLKSSTRPQSLIFTCSGLRSKSRFFFSLLKPQDQGDESKSVPTYLMNCPYLLYGTIDPSPSVHGLNFHGPPSKLIVFNPSTRRSIMLPKIDSERISVYHHLGYDPINGDVKVLCMMKGMHVFWGSYLAHELRVLTLGKGASWRMIKDFPPHYLAIHDTPDLCINGVLYYVALLDTELLSNAVMCFDVRSETFDLIKGPEPFVTCAHPKLTRYEGKVAILSSERGGTINLWVLQDSAKHEWSKKTYVFSIRDINTYFHHHPFCTNDAGEIVLAPECVYSEPFYVLYYHPQKGTMRRVNIEGIKRIKTPLWDKDSYHITTSIFPGPVDNLMFL